MPLNQEWWNPVIGVQMRITSNGKLERLESSIATAGRNPKDAKGRKWIPFLDGDIADDTDAIEPILKNKPDLVNQVLDELF